MEGTEERGGGLGGCGQTEVGKGRKLRETKEQKG